MWKALLCFTGHRVLLVTAALLAVQFGGHSTKPSPQAMVVEKISSLPEFQRLVSASVQAPGQVFSEIRDPYVWLQYLLVKYTGIGPTVLLLLLSNFVFLLFLWELHSFMKRAVLPEVADAGVLLAILWPASYEFSLGTSYAMPCLLSVIALRHAVEERWFIVGPALAVLYLMEPWTIGLWLPLLAAFLISQRHLDWSEFGQKAVLFLLLPIAVLAWNPGPAAALPGDMSQSALARLFDIAIRRDGGAWTFSHSYLGQTLSIILFFLGAAASFGAMATWLQRLVPMFLLVLVLAFTSYKDIGSRILFAAPALQGIASHAARPLLGFLQAMLLLTGMYEVFVLFAGG